MPFGCEVVENRSAVFGPQIFAGLKIQKVLRQFVTIIYPLPRGQVWLSSVV